MKAALVTGALGGIGRAICEEFALAGYRVISTDRAPGTLPSGEVICADLQDLVSDAARRNAFVEQVKSALAGASLAVLINNAAVQLLGSTEEIELRHWRETLDVNLLAPFMLTQAFLPQLSAAAGSVINIASIHANMTKPGFVCYATSKAALVGLTKSMAVDLGPRLRVNAILPAAISTPMLADGFAGAPDALERLGEAHPIGRIGTPCEVARTALFMASADAPFMSGACVELDGGVSRRLHDPL